jgi:RNA polymerase sigma factor (sigma-70 family)
VEDAPAGPADRSGLDLSILVRAAAEGDQDAWDVLVDRFAALLWSTARRYWLSEADAADACQMTWLKLLEHLGSIKDPARLPGWLSTTCRRECLALLRRSGRTVPVSDENFLDARSVPAEGTDHPIIVADVYDTLWTAFGRLNDRCQRLLRVLIADAEEGPPSYQGAATTLGMPIGSLGPTRARCLDRLRKLLDDGGI